MTLQGGLVLRGYQNSSEHSPRTCLSERLFLFVLLTIDHIHIQNTHPLIQTHSSPYLYVECNLFIVLSLTPVSFEC